MPRESATAANQMDTIHASCFQGILRASDAGSTVDGKPSGASGSIQARLVQMSGATSLPGSVLWQFACARSHTHTHKHTHVWQGFQTLLRKTTHHYCQLTALRRPLSFLVSVASSGRLTKRETDKITSTSLVICSMAHCTENTGGRPRDGQD